VFGISGFDILIIAVAGLILLGPEKLPELAQTIGKGIAMFKRAQEDMQSVITAEMFTIDDSKSESGASAAPDVSIASELYATTDEDEEEEDEE